MTMALPRSQMTLEIPDVSWDAVRARVHRLWEARTAPHHSIMGLTRCGKSYLMCNGILELCKWDRVLIVDVKGDDPSLQVGKPVRHIPRVFRAVRDMVMEEKPKQNWYRIVTYPNWADAHEQIGEAFEYVFEQGDFVVVIDELRAIVDPKPPGINLKPEWERFMLRGGSKGISMVNSTQEPRWVPHSFYTQPSFLWLSRIEDEASQKRVAEIGSSRGLLPHLDRVRKRDWIYSDNEEEDRFWAKTRVVRGGVR